MIYLSYLPIVLAVMQSTDNQEPILLVCAYSPHLHYLYPSVDHRYIYLPLP